MPRNYYKDDPRWIKARKKGYCHGCRARIVPGDRILYYPKGWKTYCEVCGEPMWSEFIILAEAEYRETGPEPNYFSF